MRIGAVYTAFSLFAFALPFETGVFAQEQGEPAEMQIKASVKAVTQESARDIAQESRRAAAIPAKRRRVGETS